MKNLLIKKSAYAICYIFIAFMLEMITFLTMGIGVLPSYLGFDICIILMLAFFIFILPHTVAQLIVTLFLIAVQMILSMVNVSLYSMSEMVFSMGLLNLSKEVAGVMDASFLDWGFVSALIIIFCLAAAGLIVWQVRYPVQKGLYKRNTIIIMVCAFLALESCLAMIYSGIVNGLYTKVEESKDEFALFYDEGELYQDQIFAAKAFIEFGTFGYMIVNMANTVFSKTYVDDLTIQDIDEYFASGKMSSTVYGDNIYTGSIAGKNIVLTVIESGEWYAINKEYTPTLYALAEQGIAATNFHARDKTNCSEAISIMGGYPSVSAIEPSKVIDNSMPYTYANILKSQGDYTTNYFHINSQDYYNRKTVFSNLYGYENLYFLEDLDLLDGNKNKTGFYDFDKDSEVFKYYSNEFTRLCHNKWLIFDEK